MKRFLLSVILLGLCCFGVVYFFAHQPNEAFQGPASIQFSRGTSTRELAARLTKAGVVRSPWHFLAARILHPRSRIMAGDYSFDKPSTPDEIIGRLIRGEVYFYPLIVPEGFNIFDIGKAAEAQGLFSADAFVEQAQKPGMIRDFAPGATSLEGFLFPSTYHLTYHSSPEQVCRMMTLEFRKQWKELGSPADPLRLVTLASLVEKEAALKEERPQVASVFENRLKRGVKLDCDPTTAYAAMLLGVWKGKIYRSDLNRKHPYNTYKVAGLPPGPIANPGLASLNAALKPANSKNLYFVARADGSGGHNFSETLTLHNKAVTEYRRAVKKPK